MRRAGATRPSRFVLVLASALTTAAASCGGHDITGPGRPITELPRPLTQSEQDVISASNTFAVDLLAQVHRASPEATVFLSPLSASMALGMTMNGAGGATREQMRTMLGFGSLPMGEIDASYHNLLDMLTGLDARVDLRIASAIFHDREFVMRPPFLDTVRTFFRAHVEGLDFSDPSAVGTIDGWVKGATVGRIESIVDSPLDPTLVAILLNAVYFKGEWTRAFDKKDTYAGPFHLDDGNTQDVRFMTKKDTVPYLATDHWQAVELPYGGGAFEMTVAVPRAGATLDDVVADLGEILTPAAQWPTHEVEIHLPRFRLTWDHLLNGDLKALGMVDAFSSPPADFTPMSAQEGLYVEWVRQKTFLQVDEEGTTAAAVTGVGVGLTSLPSYPVLRADRPFLLAIRERLSGTVLFAGLIVQAPVE